VLCVVSVAGSRSSSPAARQDFARLGNNNNDNNNNTRFVERRGAIASEAQRGKLSGDMVSNDELERTISELTCDVLNASDITDHF